jgi:hypothetical protein
MASSGSRGTELTVAWMRANGISIGELSRRTGIERVHLSRILRGHTQSVSIKSALAIQKATSGAVKVVHFVEQSRAAS